MTDQAKKTIDQIFTSTTVRMIFGFLVIGGTFAIAFFLIFHEMPERNRDVFNVLLGGIITAFILTNKYWFERSQDYSDTKNVERTKKMSEIVKDINANE